MNDVSPVLRPVSSESDEGGEQSHNEAHPSPPLRPGGASCTDLSPEGFAALGAAQQVTRMSQVAQYFEDQEAAAELVREADPIVYRTYQFPARPDQPDILTVITVIEPGRVGTQFFMTRGHFHASPDGAEVVIGISGTGRLLLQGRDGVLATLPIAPRCLAYVPAGYAHRAVNTGEEPLVFVSLCRADVGHDYDTARRLNFRETGRQVG